MSGDRYHRFLDAGPLVDLIDRLIAEHDNLAVDARVRGDNLPSLNEYLNRRLGVNRRQVYRWRTAGRIGVVTADRVACRLGLHPCEVWGNDWWSIPPTKKDAPAADDQADLFDAA